MLYIGLDAGASKTKLLARRRGADDLMLDGPAANLQRLGLSETTRVLAGLVRRGWAAHEKTESEAAQHVRLCAGVAGAGAPDAGAALEAALHDALDDLPLANVHVVQDVEIALEAAFEGESGMIVIAGTGSVVFARTEDGDLERAGGWGYLLGDEGSGHAVGLAGLRAVAAALDGGPATRLRTLLDDRHGVAGRPALLRAVYREDGFVQQVAPLIVEAAEAGDAAAARILEEQTRLLAAQARRLNGCCSTLTPQLALMGGLTREAPYRARLEAALHEQLPGWTIRAPAHQPVVGAVRLAAGRTADS